MAERRPNNSLIGAALSAVSIVLTAGSLALAGSAMPSLEHRFLQDNHTAMSIMMRGMTIKPTGDVDRDFAAMMIPHHQGAIDMAVAELRYGHDEQLRRLAQEIVVDQQQEIAAMRLAVGMPLPPSSAAPTTMPASLDRGTMPKDK